MNNIANIPYVEAEFDKKGTLQSTVALPAGVTDLFVISHGWNNNRDEARALYSRLFGNFAAVGGLNDPARRFAIIGLIWPSKKFDESLAVEGGGDAHGSASLGGDSDDKEARFAVAKKLDAMKELFTEPAAQKTLDEVKALLPDLENKEDARRAFADKIRSLLDPSAANEEDSSDTFFETDGNELMKELKVTEDDLDDELASGGGASLPLSVGVGAAPGGAAGLTDFLSGFKAAAMNVLNFTTYYVMKERAGTVGKNGVAKLIDQLDPQVQRIHLVGHSFGGRVVTATAANSSTGKIKSLTLLQAAFSHNGFSKNMNGFFRTVVDNNRVNGPILVTHTKNDKAVGIAYPMAARINGDKTAAFGDENDVYGGIGRNGAQQMGDAERIIGKLLAVGSAYAFQPGKFFNLEASAFIKNHSDVTGKEVAHAVRCAIA